MLVTVPRLERMPTLKDMARDAHIDSMPFGLLAIRPASRDILLPRAQAVPLGVTINRTSNSPARWRVNSITSTARSSPNRIHHWRCSAFGWHGRTEQNVQVTQQRHLPLRRRGDGQAKGDEHVHDPKRLRATDPGTVEGNPSSSTTTRSTLLTRSGRPQGTLSSGQSRRCGSQGKTCRAINNFLEPSAKNAPTSSPIHDPRDVLANGIRRMQAEAKQTMELVREKTGLSYSLDLFADELDIFGNED